MVVVQHPLAAGQGLWRARGAQLCFHVRAGSYDTDSLIGVLEGLRTFLDGEKATLLWDGLPSHRGTAMHR